MPDQLLDALSEQPSYEVEILRNKYALETAAWAYTPFLNQTTLSTLHSLRHSVKLHVLIAPTDSELLRALGTFIAAQTGTLRSLKIHASGRLWPGSSVPTILFFKAMLVQDPKFYLVRSMAWLVDPLLQAEKKLRLRELELTNFCICQCERVDLNSFLDADRLVSLELSCFRFLQNRRARLLSLRHLALSFRNGYVLDREKCITDWPKEVVREFLLICEGLRELELVDRPDILNDEVLRSLGSSLLSLGVHRTIPTSPDQERHNQPYVIADVEGYPHTLVDMLGRHCQSLQSLSISAPAPWGQVNSKLTRSNIDPMLTVLSLIRCLTTSQARFPTYRRLTYTATLSHTNCLMVNGMAVSANLIWCLYGTISTSHGAESSKECVFAFKQQLKQVDTTTFNYGGDFVTDMNVRMSWSGRQLETPAKRKT